MAGAATNPHAEALLTAVRRLPGVDTEVDDAHASAEVRVRDRPVARIDLLDGHVLVRLPADRIAALCRLFPSSRETAEGIVFDVTGPRDASAALAAIRRRVDVETFAPQFRVGSP